MAIVLSPSAPARGATLADDLRFMPSTSTDVIGYVVHVGSSSGFVSTGSGTLIDVGANYQMVGSEAHVPLSALLTGSAYVVMQAYDSEGLYSVASNEVYVSIDPPVAGCSSDADCGDANACNGAESCVAGACVAGQALSCSSPGQCESAWCDVASGCRTSAVPNGTSCNDGNGATVADSCQAGVCVGSVPAPAPPPEPDPAPPASPDPNPAPAPEPTPAPAPIPETSGDETFLLFDDFETVQLGEEAPGWVVTDAAGVAHAWKLFVAANEGGGRAFTLPWTVDHPYFAHFDAPGSDQWTSYEYTGRMRVADAQGVIGATILSTHLEGGGDVALVRTATRPSFWLELSPDDSPLTCVSGDDTGYVPEPGAWSIFRLRALAERDGLRVQAKVWDQRDAEPAGWPIDCLAEGRVDTTGRPGLIAGGAGEKQFDDLGAWQIAASMGSSEVTVPLFADDFDAHLPGEDPDGWIDASLSYMNKQIGAAYRVEEDARGERALFAQAGGRSLTSHVDAPDAHLWQDYEVTGRMMVPHLRTRHGVVVYSELLQGRGAIGLTRAGTSGAFRVALLDVAGATCEGTTSTGVTARAGEWNRFRLRATTSGSAVRVLARVWSDSAAEPTSWQADCTTTSGGAPTSGAVGVWSGRSGPKYWDDIVVRAVGAP